MERKKSTQEAILAGVIFVVLAVLQLVAIVNGGTISIAAICSIVGLVIIAYSLLTLHKDTLLIIGFGIKAVSALLGVISFSHSALLGVIIFSQIVAFVAWAITALFTLVCVKKEFVQYRKAVRKVWYAPAICIVIVPIVEFLLVGGGSGVSLINPLLQFAGLLLSMYWIA